MSIKIYLSNISKRDAKLSVQILLVRLEKYMMVMALTNGKLLKRSRTAITDRHLFALYDHRHTAYSFR